MLPAPEIIAEITGNLANLHLEGNTIAQVLTAVFAPLLRTAPNPDHLVPVSPRKRAGRLQLRTRKAPQRKKAKRHVPRDARERARAALKANPGLSLTRVAKAAGVSRSTVVNAGRDLAAEARRTARREAKAVPAPRETKSKAAPESNEPRQRAQRFLREQLGRGPRPVSDIEAAASRARVDEVALGQARADLGVVTSRANTGGVHAVQWQLPGWSN